MYSSDQLNALLPDWKFENNPIIKKFVFKDFLSAINFMVLISAFCEENNHHPEWTNVYNKLTVRLTTHDKGGITEKDVMLAKHIDEKFLLIRK